MSQGVAAVLIICMGYSAWWNRHLVNRMKVATRDGTNVEQALRKQL